MSTPLRNAKPAWLGLVLTAALSASLGCRKPVPPSENTAATTANAPAPAPDGLVAEFIVSHPDRTWATARTTMGPQSSFVPKSPAIYLGTLLGLPLSTFEQLDFLS